MARSRGPNRKQRSQPAILPAPIGGLNGRDGLADMPASDAFLLDNWWPGTVGMDSRNGYTSYSTGLGAPVLSLLAYEGGAAQKLLGCAGGKIYDVTAGGAVGAALVAGRANDQVQTAMFSNAGAQFLLGVNGADTPFSYNTTAGYAALTITGVTGAGQNSLVNVFAFQGRVYLIQTGMLGFYYLPVGQIQGAASYFDLAQVAKRGGYIVAMGSYSTDSGDGPNDYAVFATSLGEYIVYGGYDPSNAATWQLVGRFYAAPPISRRCFEHYGDDLMVITTDGMIPLSVIRSPGAIAPELNITAKLGRLLSDYVRYSTVAGWQMLTYERGGMLILNVPASGSTAGSYVQYVMNTKTRAWTRFIGINALCFAKLNGTVYFGQADGRVMQFDNGRNDDGRSIVFDCRQAYTNFEDGTGVGSYSKHFNFIHLIIAALGAPQLSGQLTVDYQNDQPQLIGNATVVGAGAQWDTSTWDLTDWEYDYVTQEAVVGVARLGKAASLWFRVSAKDQALRWFSTKYVFERTLGLL